ncbi:hypothetical protein ACFPME_16990 [Rhodanobacter umsongensis]|uniref:CPBP family intramembrane metalloprotease n=1 Tax=Rhodanobacter umsongensis TaxID=633153 RepID=A0ABW0JQD2_9GAMM
MPSTCWRAESVAPLWRILAASGFGLWAWLGLALLLGLYPAGRNGTLMPLLVGTLLTGTGLLVACLPWRIASDWYGWRPRRDSRPNRAALLALATFLPMLAVAGLARGNNIFWATRLAGAALTACSLSSLAYTGYRFCRQLSPPAQRVATSLPISRLVFAGYAGGLWLWLCVLALGESTPRHGLYPWIVLLLALALLLGLLEGLAWQALAGSASHGGVAREQALRPARFAAALFTYVIPCIALLLTRHEGIDLIAAALAVPSCLLGKCVERSLYESLLVHGTAA